jgi:hypothetical protein
MEIHSVIAEFPCGQTDVHGEANSRVPNFTNTLKNTVAYENVKDY